jgi:hypothetical protein
MSLEIQVSPPYALSPVDVCNNALDQLAQEPIDSFDDGTPASKACRRYFPSILRAMLRDHKWNFAYRRVYLPQLSQEIIRQILSGFGGGGFGEGGFGGEQTTITVVGVTALYFPFWFSTPNNMVRAWRINHTDKSQFKIEGRILQSNESPVLLEYEAYIDDPNVWDGMFQMAFESFLASRLSLRLTKDQKQAAVLYSAYQQQVGEAKASDGQEGTPERISVDTFIEIRE